jgi:hypothetical protein
MRLALLFPLFALLAAPAAAADLAKIDRSIKKEPAYKGKPAYLLLAFGDKAQGRVWLVHDGDHLYVDRDGDGDLSGKDEKVAHRKVDKNQADRESWTFEVGELRVGGKVHKALTVYIAPLKAYADSPTMKGFRPFQEAMKADPKGRLARVNLDVQSSRLKGGGLGGRLSVTAGVIDTAGVLQFAAKAKDAPVVHPDGPLQITLYGPKPSLILDRGNDLVLVAGAAGRGPGTLSMLLYDEAIPEGAHPKVEVAWPGAREGDKPVKETYELKERC